MIIEKPVTIGDVVSIRLFEGSELLAKVIAVEFDHFKVNHTYCIQTQFDQYGNPVIGLAPLMSTVPPEAHLTIMKTNILAFHKADESNQIVQAYRQNTSGLKTASSLSSLQL